MLFGRNGKGWLQGMMLTLPARFMNRNHLWARAVCSNHHRRTGIRAGQSAPTPSEDRSGEVQDAARA